MDVNVMILTQGKHHLVERAILEAGGSFRTSRANVIAATVPLLSIPWLSRNANIKYIELGVYGQYSLNDSLPETKADRVHQGAFPLPRSYMGTGVIVGVIDSGIDFAHADFRNADGSTRILSIWDQTLVPILGELNPTDLFPFAQASSLGVEYRQCDIDFTLLGCDPANDPCPDLDGVCVRQTAVSFHGTAVSGVAASNGLALGEFTGMAPDADIIFIKGGDDFPDFSKLCDAVHYIFERAATLGIAAVVNISAGDRFGPHDGSTVLEACLNAETGPGRIIVAASGNLPSRGDLGSWHGAHASGVVPSGGIKEISFQGLSSPFVIELWYKGSDEVDVQLITPYGESAPLLPYPHTSDDLSITTTSLGDIIRLQRYLNLTNNDYKVSILVHRSNIDNSFWTLKLIGGTIVDGTIHAYANANSPNFATDADPTVTVNSPSTASEIISVGSYNIKFNWESLAGPQEYPSNDLYIYGTDWNSARGPSRNPARTGQKPELVASGKVVASALSSQDTGITAESITVDGLHVVSAGTSFASPHVAGAVALLLEQDPTLTPAWVEYFLTNNTCIDHLAACSDDTETDPLTGLPDGAWGFGKLDIFSALQSLLPETIITGFPSLVADDGKMVNVVGQGLATLDVPILTFFITVRGDTTNFSIDIFDGDQGDAFDIGVEPTYFSIYEDPLKTGTGGALVERKANTNFSNNAWSSLFSGPNSSGALSGAGTYVYRLEVTLGPDPVNPDPTLYTMNSFKIRATGLVSLEYSNFQFISGDSSGTFSSPNPYFSRGVDTQFDGAFGFKILVPSLLDHFTLTDCDADYLGDETIGVADGANGIIRYDVYSPDGTVVLSNSDPSGNYDGRRVPPDMDCEVNIISTGNVGGVYYWEWSSVWTENNIHVRVTTSPAQLPVFGEDTTPEIIGELFKNSSVKGHGFFANGSNMADYLPLTLGTLDEYSVPVGLSAIVETDSFAREILMGYSGPLGQAERAVAKVKSQLLAVKLNVIRSSRYFNEPLVFARLLGTEITVGEIITQADDLLSRFNNVGELNQLAIFEFNEINKLLDMINEGQITYGPLYFETSLLRAFGVNDQQNIEMPPDRPRL